MKKPDCRHHSLRRNELELHRIEEPLSRIPYERGVSTYALLVEHIELPLLHLQNNAFDCIAVLLNGMSYVCILDINSAVQENLHKM